jgi:hypothetical protein
VTEKFSTKPGTTSEFQRASFAEEMGDRCEQAIVLMGLVWQALADKDPDSYFALLKHADVAS